MRSDKRRTLSVAVSPLNVLTIASLPVLIAASSATTTQTDVSAQQTAVAAATTTLAHNRHTHTHTRTQRTENRAKATPHTTTLPKPRLGTFGCARYKWHVREQPCNGTTNGKEEAQKSAAYTKAARRGEKSYPSLLRACMPATRTHRIGWHAQFA